MWTWMRSSAPQSLMELRDAPVIAICTFGGPDEEAILGRTELRRAKTRTIRSGTKGKRSIAELTYKFTLYT